MKVVIDTNVFVSSFLGGKPRRVIDHWRDGSVTLCCAQSILEEYFRVLETLDFVSGSELQELVALFHEQYNLIYAAKLPEIKVVDADPADDKFIACAVELDAEIVVSGDEPLLSVGNYGEIAVQTPADFSKIFRNKVSGSTQ